MNKKIVSLILAMLFVLSVIASAFIGCTNQGSGDNVTTTVSSTAETQPETTILEETSVPTTTQLETTVSEKEISVESLVEKIKTASNANQVSVMDNTIASEFYNNLDLTLLEEYSFNMPLINVKCDELTIVKVKDSKDIDTVKKAMDYRYDNIVKMWERYLPDQYEIVQKGKIIVKGNYIMLLVTEGVEEGIKAFNEALA